MQVRLMHKRFLGRGFTTRQIVAAPQGSLFVWPLDNTDYPRAIAEKMNRKDLTISGPRILQRLELLRRYANIVMDHGCECDPVEDEALLIYQTGGGHVLRLGLHANTPAA